MVIYKMIRVSPETHAKLEKIKRLWLKEIPGTIPMGALIDWMAEQELEHLED